MEQRKCDVMRLLKKRKRLIIFVSLATIKLAFILFFGTALSGINQDANISDRAIWIFKDGEKETRQEVDIGTKRNNTSGPEVRHVAFLKVHKAASSTAMNIFLRFGYKRNLVFVLPSSDSNVISHFESLKYNNTLPAPVGKRYDILCNHVIYNKKQFKTFLGDPVLIGIVREPYQQFVSSFYYFRSVWQEPYLLKLPHQNPIYNLLKNPELYEPKSPAASWTNNRQSVDFGFPSDLFVNADPSRIHEYLEQLNSDFRLVMIAEYFDESVILLRRYLNWTIKDVLYISINIQRYKRRPFRAEYELRHLHKLRAPLDYALYDFFIKVFWQKISQEEDNFHEEVVYFRKLRFNVENFCRENTRKPETTFTATESRWHALFTIQKDDCERLLTPEVAFTDLIKYKQYPEFRTNLWPKPNIVHRQRKGRKEAIQQHWIIQQNNRIFRHLVN